MADLVIKPAYRSPKIKDWRRLSLDNYYFVTEKADTAGRNSDQRQLYIPELSEAVQDYLGYKVLFENFNKRINELSARVLQNEADIADLQSRVWDLEQVQQVLVDGVYGLAYSVPDIAWSPGVTSPVDAARIPVADVALQSNISKPNDYSFSPLFDADYILDLRIDIDLSGAQNNRNWTIAVFLNGTQNGPGFSFNTRDYTELFLTGLIGGMFDVGDQVDVRLWSTNAGSSLVIRDFAYSIKWLGLDDPLRDLAI